MIINAKSLITKIRSAFLECDCELIEGENNRFMIQITKSPAFVVIEYDGFSDIGISRIRSHAESWLGGHQVVLENAKMDTVINSLQELLKEP